MSTELSLNNGPTTLKYSKERLNKLYGVDIFSAAASAAMVAPFIAVVDRSIMENLNGKRPLVEGLKYGLRTIVTQPIKFAFSKQFGVIFGLYLSTYTTANITETTCEQYNIDPERTSMYKFLATSGANIFLCVAKDRVFAKMFGTAASANTRFPKLSYLLFAARDSLTIAASFTAPPYIARYLQEKEWTKSNDSANALAQLFCPAIVQFASTPVHLYGLDLYNRPTATSAMRAGLVRKEYFKSCLARVGRIGPAFGLGGIGNTYFRSYRNKFV